jgi:hypothetical protein
VGKFLPFSSTLNNQGMIAKTLTVLIDFKYPALFNQKMSHWLVFYNTELPHIYRSSPTRRKQLP